MNLYFMHGPGYNNFSGFIRKLLGELMEKKGHKVWFYPQVPNAKPDLLIALDPPIFDLAIEVSIMNKTPMIAFCHAVPFDRESWEFPKIKRCFDEAIRVVCVSKDIADKLKERKDLKTFIANIDYLYFGFDERVYENIDPKTKKIDKNTLVVFGDDAPHRKVKFAKQVADKLNMKLIRIKHPMSDKEKAEILLSAGCLICPVVQVAGMDIPPIEAMYCGVPVAVSDTDYHREFCDDYAEFFESDNIDQACEAVKKAMNRTIEQITVAHNWSLYFTTEKMADRFDEYLKLLESSLTGKIYDKEYYHPSKAQKRFGDTCIGYMKGHIHLENDIWRATADSICKCIDLKNKFVLDFGCGNGYLIYRLVERGINAYGIDLNDVFDERVKNRCIANDIIGFAGLKTSDTDEYVFFDAIISYMTFEHLYSGDVGEIIKKMHEIIKPGGVIIATIDIHGVHREFTHICLKPRKWWHAQFVNNGFVRDEELEKKFMQNKVYQEWEYFVYRKPVIE